MENYMSGYLEDFINFINAVKEQNDISLAELESVNVDMQDLEHFIEFGKADGKLRQKIYKLYQGSRSRRRQAKENLELCKPIIEWAEKNKKVLSDLRTLHAQIHRIESMQVGRAYAIRGHILDDVTDEEIILYLKENYSIDAQWIEFMIISKENGPVKKYTY